MNLASQSKAETIQPFIKIEDILICSDCPKSDVCVVLKSLTMQHLSNNEFKKTTEDQYQVTVDIRTSISSCKHKPNSEVNL